jgi:carboxymethylenebutenolidase
MCSDPDSRPPIPPDPQGRASGNHIRLTGSDGNAFTAFRANSPTATDSGIIVLPDYYGLTPFYEALALRFAEAGIEALAIDYYGRTAPHPPRDAGFDHVAHSARSTWTGLQADVDAAARALRSQHGLTRLFSIGFCFGGRTSFLLGTLSELALDGVIGFYGWPVGDFANDSPAPVDVTEQLVSPLLGVFGGADPKISPADVAAFERALEHAPVDHTVLSYEGAPHSFFDRQHAAHHETAMAAWAEVLGFIRTASAT